MAIGGQAAAYEDLYRDVLTTADGMSRADCVARARAALDHANWCRTAYPGVLKAETRNPAVNRARAWEDVLWYLNKTGAEAFSEEGSRQYQKAPWWKLWGWATMVNPVGWWQAFTDVFGSRPIAFRTSVEREFPAEVADGQAVTAIQGTGNDFASGC
jgi:hypothetical protein